MLVINFASTFFMRENATNDKMANPIRRIYALDNEIPSTSATMACICGDNERTSRKEVRIK